VSTREVEEVIVACPGVAEAVVYGVTVSGAEGRAGMAAIVTGDGFDLAELHRRLVEHLPDYARPMFLRLCNRIRMTATFKPHKQQFASEGYDPASITDELYFDARMLGKYVVLDLPLHEGLRTGKVRF
jgi:fatty-acyl-CoA synthase